MFEDLLQVLPNRCVELEVAMNEEIVFLCSIGALIDCVRRALWLVVQVDHVGTMCKFVTSYIPNNSPWRCVRISNLVV